MEKEYVNVIVLTFIFLPAAWPAPYRSSTLEAFNIPLPALQKRVKATQYQCK